MSNHSNQSTKCPPFGASLGASSRYVHKPRMTSTASNTFNEEDVENYERKCVVAQAAAKISEMVAIKGGVGETKMFNFNYLKFSRDLPNHYNWK